MLDLRIDRFRDYAGKLAVLASAIVLMIFAWGNFFHANMCANAATLDGVTDQLAGKVQKDIGTKRRAVGDIMDNPSEEAKGALQQAKGSTKQGLGDAKNKLDDAQNTVENQTESLVDSVKEFFD